MPDFAKSRSAPRLTKHTSEKRRDKAEFRVRMIADKLMQNFIEIF